MKYRNLGRTGWRVSEISVQLHCPPTDDKRPSTPPNAGETACATKENQ
jgi:hypothetical protein